MLNRSREGFTLIEIMIAIVMLSVAILGLAASSSKMLEPTNSAENDFIALEHVQDRLAEVRLDPRYGLLDSLYATTDSPLVGLPGAVRVTTFARTQDVQPSGKVVDYWTVVVTVRGGRVSAPVMRSLIIAAP